MHVGIWVAIAAAVISCAALIYSHLSWREARRSAAAADRSAAAAERAAASAEKQTEIQQALRIESSQPFVWADVRPDEAAGTILNLVVGNAGPTVARNVRVIADRALPFVEELRERAENAQRVLAAGIPALPPGRTISWPLGQGFNLIPKAGQQRYTLTVTADGPFGAVEPLVYTIDLGDLRGSLDRPTGSLHMLTKAVENAASRLGQPAPRQDGLPS